MILRKWLLYSFIILCLFSIFTDLKIGSPIDYTTDEQALTNDKDRIVIGTKEQLKFEVVSHQITVGDTFISIMDQINEQSLDWNLERYINDFKALNPKVNVHQLQEDVTYLFPHYIN